jgi:hypothetical protein
LVVSLSIRTVRFSKRLFIWSIGNQPSNLGY